VNRTPKHESALRSFVVLLASVAAVAAVILGLAAYGLFASATPSGFNLGTTAPGNGQPTAQPVSTPCPAGTTAEPAFGVMALIPVYGERPDGTVCIPTALLRGGH
jgi:hypothetical protein